MRDLASQLSFVFFSLSFLIAVYAALQVVSFPFQLRIASGPSQTSAIPNFGPILIKPIDEYLDRFSTHALFYVPKAPELAPVHGISELAAQYELTGIIQGVEPEALIVNRATKQTHFVQVDEEFDQLKLVEIKDHGIVVEYEGERKEINIEGGA